MARHASAKSLGIVFVVSSRFRRKKRRRVTMSAVAELRRAIYVPPTQGVLFMGIQVECEQCGYKYHLKDELAGKKVKCKICRAPFVVAAGGPVYVHAPRTKEFEIAIGDTENIELISDHIGRHYGKIAVVWHEIISDLVHVDVHWVQPTAERPYHTLVTSGMSDRPMTVPAGAEEHRYAELMLSLPADWPLSSEAFQDDSNYWPVRLLKMLARFPHEYDTWMCFGHT